MRGYLGGEPHVDSLGLKGRYPREWYVSYFWSKVVKSTNCWIWTGHVDRKTGYGRFTRRHLSAHRFSYELAYGSIPEGLMVCHRCDVPACVRPDHLFTGSSRDNMLDAAQKDRTLYGERNAFHRLTADAVRQAREAYAKGASSAVLAEGLGVRRCTIQDVLRGRSWRRAGGPIVEARRPGQYDPERRRAGLLAGWQTRRRAKLP